MSKVARRGHRIRLIPPSCVKPKMGELSLRRLLIIGANSVIIKRHVHTSAGACAWREEGAWSGSRRVGFGRAGQQDDVDHLQGKAWAELCRDLAISGDTDDEALRADAATMARMAESVVSVSTSSGVRIWEMRRTGTIEMDPGLGDVPVGMRADPAPRAALEHFAIGGDHVVIADIASATVLMPAAEFGSDGCPRSLTPHILTKPERTAFNKTRASPVMTEPWPGPRWRREPNVLRSLNVCLIRMHQCGLPMVWFATLALNPRARRNDRGERMQANESEKNTEKKSLDFDRSLNNARLLEPMMYAQKVTGKSPFVIGAEILRLSLGKAKIAPSEYFKYKLFEKEREDKVKFVGVKRSTAINVAANAASQLSYFAGNKLLLESALRGLGIRTTHTQAIFCSPERHPSLGFLQLLHSKSELAGYLSRADFPIFGKPLISYQSLGSVGIAGFDEVEEELLLTTGKTVKFSEFYDQISQRYFYSGYAFQEMIEMHPELRDFTNNAVGTFRVVTAATPNGSSVLYAAWKIPGRDSMADNFWREGNMIASIDADSGEVLRCQKSTGLDTKLVDVDPESGRQIVGLKVPLWERVRAIALEVASILPDERVLGFDVALSPEGPILIEANTNPDHGLYQVATGEGLWSEKNAAIFEWNAAMAKERKKAVRLDAVRDYKTHLKREKSNVKQGLSSDTSLVFKNGTTKNHQ